MSYKGFTLFEFLVVIIILAILTGFALPYYLNAVESARMTEVVLLWGQQKNWISGQILSPAQAQRVNERLRTQSKLKYFTGTLVCREKDNPDEICWEAEFSQIKEKAHARYKLVTTHNFTRLACIPINGAGEDFCLGQALDENSPEPIGAEKAYWIK